MSACLKGWRGLLRIQERGISSSAKMPIKNGWVCLAIIGCRHSARLRKKTGGMAILAGKGIKTEFRVISPAQGSWRVYAPLFLCFTCV
jgi:hypothetical protein